MEIKPDPLLQEFLSEKRTESTKKRTRIHLQNYCKFTEQKPTELIKEAWKESKSELPPWERGLKGKIKGFKEHLEEKNYSESTVKEAVTAVRSFYSHFEIPLPRMRFQYVETDTASNVVGKTSDLPGREEIKYALQFAKPRMTAIILTMASSGMDASTTRSITVQDFIDGLGDIARTSENGLLDIEETRVEFERTNGPIVTWNVRRKKLGLKGKDYFTFSTPEAIEAILFYLEQQPPSKPTDTLFRNRNEKKIGDILFSNYFKRINTLCGFGKRGRFIYFRSHNLRKFFGNMMDPVLGRRDTEYLMGHQREKDSISRSYYYPDMQALRIRYREHMGKLTFLEEITQREVTNERLLEMENQMKEYEARLSEVQRSTNIVVDYEKTEKPD